MSVDEAALRERYAAVRARIEAACQRAGRPADSVRLLAVSKVHPAAAIRALYQAGQRDFGENYAQELAEKAEVLADLDQIRWHFIGNFQRNKAGLLATHCHAVHTVAGRKAASALGRRSGELGKRIEVMLQVNVGREPQKAGLAPEAVAEEVGAVATVEGVHLVGLMTIPPADDAQAARACYEQLAQLAADHSLPQLSMGMSGDLELAVACGATWVRIGSDLFGPRPR